MRVPAWSVAVTLAGATLLASAGCSGGASDGPVRTTVPLADDTIPGTVADLEVEPTPSTTEPIPPTVVTVTVAVPEAGIDTTVTAELSNDGDPFGDFASCSGVRREVGAYSVAISQTGGEIRSVSLLTTSRVTGPGTIDADARLELADGTAVVAAGTMTLDPGLRSGSYLAFDAGGRRVEGAFECLGSDAPTPVGSDEGPPLEVVALLRRGDTERIVSLASSDPELVSCPSDGSDQPLVVRADGGPSLGALTTFELTVDGDDASLRLRVGDEVGEFRPVDVTLDEARRAGTFSAVDGDLTVDGAFSCE